MKLRVTPAILAVFCVAASGSAAQVPDSIVDPNAPGNCTLVWESMTPETLGTAVRDGPEAHITYVSGRMLWTCGTATMEADSAVKYDQLRKVDLFGTVIYQDSIRTLESTFLTYFEIDDLVIADEDVELVRLVDQSRLSGPHVEFLRAVSGVDELTTATGRPHMTFYPESEEPQEPFEIDADQAQFAGEDEARFQGAVVLKRSDVNAEADSAYLTRDDGLGIMWGSPWFEAEEVRLEGDTIRFRSEDEELKEVHAEGHGFALGEQFEVRSELIDIELENEEVERVWSHGEGMSEALSGDHLLFGDSLRFAMFESKIDTIYSVGHAVGIQGDTTVATRGLRGLTPAVLDSLGNSDSLTVVPDSIRSVPAEAMDEVVAVEPVDSDTVRTDPPAVEEAPELIEDLLRSVEPGDSASALGEGDLDSEDSEEGGGDSFTGGPPLSVDGSTNWVRGDTLVAIFERPGRAPPDSLLDAALDTLPGILADSSLIARADSVAIAVGDSVGSASTDATEAGSNDDDPVMERMTAIGAASSFYSQVRDTASSEKPSRNYMIGDRIDILFDEGEPKTVLGENAIGVFLEPEAAVATDAEPRSIETQSDAVAIDSLPVQLDSLSVAPDSTGSRDTTRVRPDSVRTVRNSRPKRVPRRRQNPEQMNAARALLRSRG